LKKKLKSYGVSAVPMGRMAVGESVKNCVLWDTRRPPKGNSALPSTGALIGGPYITPSTGGITVLTTEEKLGHKESSLVRGSSEGCKEGSSQGNSGAWRLCKGQLSRTDVCRVQLRLPLFGRNTCPLAV
jgi:hypothetical protein